MVTAVLFISFVVLLLISVPIGIALGLASLATILLLDPISMETFSQSMVQGLNSFPLIAVPLFAFAGDIMGIRSSCRRVCYGALYSWHSSRYCHWCCFNHLYDFSL